ncbi:MAG: pyruvate dehydrogenase (acetyl-transferring), homodimeric type [Gammaproteobacteria bacterium RIFCSPLOWO2_02_FULL_42_14]|nr:MAG: pyruvate dehydrogenase (acetyl-transferring), homodimeric type [Gammaproteobacteria bacterium RIFCSPHIGHO2_02_FULL_42_43]OGT51189.1 MAG: pyruvate dehydrogenase (acetyl-transferring), homodimeric type [Gammaproteobacteria bacterium RIFCSPHIGHO2_12_FULL_41_25]OGT62951.1 MAG: pyruvate dehydrogenase (acetyl-transferring), homodimeric type [Gammaproteobacteria bacterium RIFCSPLOWO2_02_FULL_42_14]OGT86083.1 MAG: pyruvate dehydrogenase (acetyl-transferring), homodimeric type [Gammaproteobacteri
MSTVNQPQDIDAQETQEWRDALDSVLEFEGTERAQFLLSHLMDYAKSCGLVSEASLHTPYLNTLSSNLSPLSNQDIVLFEKLTNCMRWNAIAMVMRAGKVSAELGGHIASFGSIATLFEIGLHYFFYARSAKRDADLIYFQGHSSPGLYARAYLEGRLTETQLDGFRQELSRKGIASYPHPWLMPDFWQFPTVSMGLGPLMSIYQASFLKYLERRGLANTKERHVWVFCGDGEMGEPESLGALNIAAREQLDNLIFVINCNLQRLDGPVWGNGQVIQEYEAIFRGAGWNVIKVIWGSGWDKLFEKDQTGLLKKRISELVDGEYQAFSANDGAFFRANFFGKYRELLALVSDYSDEQLKSELLDGGHDPQKVFAAYAAAVAHLDQPTVILAKTVKGFGMGKSGEALNVAHQTKKISADDLKHFRERFGLDLSDNEIEHLHYFKPKNNSPEMQFLLENRKKLGGFLPERHSECEKLRVPALDAFQAMLNDSGDREISSTMAFVRILSMLLKDANIKERIVPIVADESRTFGMEGLFRQIGIYSAMGQRYQPQDKHLLMYYREDQKGQLLQEGISEAGAMSAWIAAATSYATNQLPMIPFYIYYSMFGYQRFGDLIWAAGDMRARGFILGGTAGRTTLAGEGLQHQDGHNYLMFGVVPNCVSYDPTFSYELAVIIQDGLRRMFANQEDIFYYVTLMNENYHHPAMPKNSERGILQGLYLFQENKNASVQLLGSGAILNEVIKAAEILATQFQITANVWSVTSFNELRKNMDAVARDNRLKSPEKRALCYVEQCFQNHAGPVIAATDYIKVTANQIRDAVHAPYYVLGTDGFGRSDTREALREFFEVDANMIAYTALYALTEDKKFSHKQLLTARDALHIDANRSDPAHT